MKVFYCPMSGGYSGGGIMVAADTIEEAILIAVKDKETSCYFTFFDARDDFGGKTAREDATIEDIKANMKPISLEDERRMWIISEQFPLPKWKQEERLAWSGEKGVIFDKCYYE